MTFFRLLGRNLIYHWRGNLAVFLGIALGTAVLTGALLVGDSLRGSLRALTLDRLGWVEQAMVPGLFFRAELAHELPASKASAVILLSGSASNDVARRQAGDVTVLGVDGGFWPDASPSWTADAADVVLNQTLASLLGVKAGDSVTLKLPKPAAIPRESLMGARKSGDVLQTLEVTVRQVLPDEGLARFTLKPTPGPTRNAFVPLRFLQNALEREGQANAVLLAGAEADLTAKLRDTVTLEDWGLRLRTPKDRALAFVHYLAPNAEDGRLKPARWRGRVPAGLAETAKANKGVLTREQVVVFYEEHRPYISLESRQLLLPRFVSSAATLLATRNLDPTDPEMSRQTIPRFILVYLADSIVVGSHETAYAVIGAVQYRLPGNGAALGPKDLALVTWPHSPLPAKPGELVTIRYDAPDEQNHFERAAATFTLRELLPLRGELDDPDLTPEFPGITDKLDMASWKNPPFPYDPKRVTPADEEYWQRYRATPKAYVALETAQKLWGSRFGDLTAVQFFGIPFAELQRDLLANLPPERGGFLFQNVREQAEQASSGSTDFGVLFLAFSFFLIAAALLLVGLLVRLNLDRRASQIGLLLALGWSPHRVRRLLLGEGLVLAVGGAVAGLVGAIGYAKLMLDLLRVNWPGGESLSFLRIHIEPQSIVYGYLGSLVVSLFTLVWATGVLGKLSPRMLLAGQTTAPAGGARPGRRWSRWVLALGWGGAVASMVWGFKATGQEAKAGSFFSSGALLLTACLAAVWIWLRHTGRQSTPRPSLTALGIRNAGRHAVRSLLTVGLLAAATFLIVAVESFHKDIPADLTDHDGRRLALVAETSVPVFQDLNRPEVRKELGLADDALFMKVHFASCRVRGGDDASCLNLYRPLEPRVVGLPPRLLCRWHGSFAAARPAELWDLLEGRFDDGTAPAALDANTAQWILKKGLGDTLEVDNGRGEKVELRIVALLEESIFQSEVLVSEANFRKLFPEQEGFSFFLIECHNCADAEVRQVQSAIETALAGQGVRVETTAARLNAYLAVENTYLATFQVLGGLGLMLGAIGLAIILLRGVWERRGELALLRALGFGPARLAWLVLAENLALLVLGLAAGTLSALVSVAPHLAGAGGQVLWLRIGSLLFVVLATGLVAGGLAVATTLRAPLLSALRRE